MFGYLVADRKLLTPEEDQRYRTAYCGLCRSLRERYGQLAGLTLNYDLCFLILLLQSLYEEEEKNGEDRCPAHPIEGRPWWMSVFTEYAADMNMALSYLKFRDDWDDDGNLAALAVSDRLHASWLDLLSRYPRQCSAMSRGVETLRALESEKQEDPDRAAETFAVMMAEIFVFREDRWAPCLRTLGASLGRFLYILDACMDLDADTFRNRYNPFRRLYGLADNDERFGRILRMLLGEGLQAFDRLPLITDTGILKNILCSGLWTAFNKKYNTDKEKTDG